MIIRDSNNVERIKSQMTLIIRAMVSNPPSHGARIVDTVLADPKLYQEWRDCIRYRNQLFYGVTLKFYLPHLKLIFLLSRTMSSRIISMRNELRQKLENLGTPGDWSHITTQIGMFSYTGLTQVWML